MVRLDQLLEVPLKSNLTPQNCWGYYDMSLQHHDISISSIVRDYIVDNFHKVLRSTEFLSEMRRDPDRVYSILIEAECFFYDRKDPSLELAKIRGVSRMHSHATSSWLEWFKYLQLHQQVCESQVVTL